MPKSNGLVLCSGESIKICNSSVVDCPTVFHVRSKIVTASVVCKYFGKSGSAFSLESVLSYFGTYPLESLGVTSSTLVTLPPLVASVKL